MGRRSAILGFALLLVAGFWPQAARADAEIAGYDLEVGVGEADTLMDIAADVRLRLQPPTARISLLLSSRAVHVGVDASTGIACLRLESSRGSGDSLIVFLPADLQGADSLLLRFHYRLPRRPLPAVTYLSRGHRWYPQIVDQIAPYRVRMTLPDGWTSFAGGDLVADMKPDAGRQMVWASEVPVFKIELALGSAAALRDRALEAGGVAFHFVSARADSAADRILADAARAFAYFSSVLGAYPYRRFTVLETTEWPGTDIGSGLVAPGEPAVDAFLAGRPEELRLAWACQWIGAGVFPRFMSPGYWFLQLSLPHYLRLMCVREAEGAGEFEKEIERSLAAYKQVAGTAEDVPIVEIAALDSPAKGAVIYGKGPYIVHRLALALGDAAWHETLRALYVRFRGRTLTCAELCAWLDERDSAGQPGARLQAMLAARGLPAGE
jgi:hypothetical protein